MDGSCVFVYFRVIADFKESLFVLRNNGGDFELCQYMSIVKFAKEEQMWRPRICTCYWYQGSKQAIDNISDIKLPVLYNVTENNKNNIYKICSKQESTHVSRKFYVHCKTNFKLKICNDDKMEPSCFIVKNAFEKLRADVFIYSIDSPCAALNIHAWEFWNNENIFTQS